MDPQPRDSTGGDRPRSQSAGLPPAAKWIGFLRQYGPIPQNGNAFDEDIQRLARRSKVAPLRLPTTASAEILELLQGTNPTSVIVTGTAGDGKTYQCRETWLALGGTAEEWDNAEKVKQLPLGARELNVIRDLSEFQASDRERWFPQIAEDLLSTDAGRIYLIAANDGRLIDEWKAAPESQAVITVREAVEELLVTGNTRHTNVRVAMKNLSRQRSAAMFVAVLEQVLEHAGWEACSACSLREGANGSFGCPIFENRRRLLSDADGRLLPKRLGELLELAERNGVHFPIRQLLLLASNVLLGHPQAEHGLMGCKDVAGIIAAGTQDRASVYRNVFGENVSSRRRETTTVFKTLGRFGVGSETSNRIDAILVYGADDPDLRAAFERMVLADPVYGGSPSFRASQRAYLESGETEDRAEFLTALRSQRQRLFFTIPDTEATALGLWDLTVFRYAGQYLEIVRRVTAGQSVPHSALATLVRGLNRVFTGILVNNQDQLLLASSGSHAQAKTSRLLEDTVPVAFRLGEGIALQREGEAVVLTVALGNVAGMSPLRLELTLLRFEFLCRVADGALPSSFSLECYEDFLAFKANIMQALQDRRRITGESAPTDADLVLRFLRVGRDGRANPEPVEVRLA